MSPEVHHLNVLGEFKPFGLVVKALDSKPQDAAINKYDYFLFDSSVAREASFGALTGGANDHEIFIRGNRIIWTTGSRVYKRFTVSCPVITFADALKEDGMVLDLEM